MIKKILLKLWTDYIRFLLPFTAPEIVQFPSGHYAIRKRIMWQTEYRDFTSSSFWWSRGSRHFGDCLTTNTEVVKKYFVPYAKAQATRKAATGKPKPVDFDLE